MPDIRLGSMVVEDFGDGTPVVLVHGLGGTSSTFEPLMETLADYHTLRPDLPGAGRSPLRPGLPGIDGLVSALRDVMAAAGIDAAHLVGHSMGTLVCQHLAAQSPQSVLSLTLLGAILEPPPAARQGLRDRAATARSQGMAGIAEAVAKAGLSTTTQAANPTVRAFVKESLLRQDPQGYANHCEVLSTAQAADHAAITCPTLLVAGAEDPVAPVAMAQQLQQNIANARLEIIPDIAHWMTAEAPMRSAELLGNFLASVE